MGGYNMSSLDLLTVGEIEFFENSNPQDEIG